MFSLLISDTLCIGCGLQLHRTLPCWWSGMPAIPRQEYTEPRLSGNWYVYAAYIHAICVRLYSPSHASHA